MKVFVVRLPFIEMNQREAEYARNRVDVLENKTHICVHCKWFGVEPERENIGSGWCKFPLPSAIEWEDNTTADWLGEDCVCWDECEQR